MSDKLLNSFFERDALVVAPELLGKIIVRKFDDGSIKKYVISEIEVYRGEEDLACHAAKGRTPRTEVMYHSGGEIYVYLIYGMYWMLNIVTNEADYPAAILIRGVESISGPGRVGKELQLDKSFYGESLQNSQRIWIEETDITVKYENTPRIGIDYAKEWVNKSWRYITIH